MATVPYGLQIFDKNTNLTYSSSNVTWNQVDMFYVAAAGSVTKTYPVLNGRETLLMQLLIDAPALDRRSIAKTLSVSGTTVTVSGGTERAYILVLMR